MSNQYNYRTQYYKDIPLQLIHRGDYRIRKAKRFTLNGTNQNVWIPNRHLLNNGTIKPNENIDYVFMKSKKKFELAGIPELYKPFKRPNY